MKRSLSDICLDIARYANDKNHEFLASLLRMAAIEARNSAGLETFDVASVGPSGMVVGLWDWDVPNNIRHLDSTGANFFGHSSSAILSEQQLTDRIHPDDVAEWRRSVFTAARLGGIYQYEYRIIHNDRVRWVRAKGQCTLSNTGRPERFPGAIIDITALKQMN